MVKGESAVIKEIYIGSTSRDKTYSYSSELSLFLLRDFTRIIDYSLRKKSLAIL